MSDDTRYFRVEGMVYVDREDVIDWLNEGLSDRSKLQSAAGGTVFVTEQGVLGFKPTETWCSGNLPWYQRVWVSLANRPFLLVLFALIAAVAAGWGIFAGMRRYLRGRSSI